MKEEKEIKSSATKALVLASCVLRPEIISEIEGGERRIKADTYEQEPFSPLSKEEPSDVKYLEKLRKQILTEAKNGKVTLSIFTCPNVNAQDFSKRAEEVMPEEFDRNQILFQRLPLLLYLH